MRALNLNVNSKSFLGFFKADAEKSSVLVVNIEDFFYEAAIVKKSKGKFLGGARVIHKGKIDFYDSGLNLSDKSAEKMLEIALNKIFRKAEESGEKIDFCLISISSLWMVSQTHLIRIRKPEPFIFTSKDFDDALKNKNSLFVKNLKSDFPLDSFQFTESEIMKFKLNGYEIKGHSPFNKKVKSIEIDLYLSIVTNDFFKLINEIAYKRLNLSFEKKNLVIKSRAFTVFSALKNFLGPRKPSLVIDLREDISEFVVIKGGLIEETVKINKGYGQIIKMIMDVLNIKYEEALSLFKRFLTSQTENNSKQKILKAVNTAKEDLEKTFLKVIKELNSEHFFASDLLLFSPIYLPETFFSLKDSKGNFFNVKNIPFKEIAAQELGDFNKTGYNNIEPFMVFELMLLNKE